MAVKKKKKKVFAKKKILKKKPAVKKVLKKKKPVTRKKPVKKVARKKAALKKAAVKIIGNITHYFPKVRAAVVKLKTPLNAGDVIKIKGHTTNFTQTVTSMQIDHVPITSAKKGQEIGLLVDSRVRRHDIVCKP